MGQAKRDQADANLGSLQGSYDDAYQNEDYTTSDPSQQQNPNSQTFRPALSLAQMQALLGQRTAYQPVIRGPIGANVFNPQQKKAPVTRVAASTYGGYYTGGGRV
jgi:hypothetical protein